MAKTEKTWFVVSKEGLRQLQEGKPKHIIIRELLQNALDEEVNIISLNSAYERGKATFVVEDDSPVGFRDLSDSFTLFKETYKRKDATKRGRFNLGEKQVFSLAEYARIITTSGTVEFDKDGRHQSRKKRDQGSEITVLIRISREEYEECLAYTRKIIVPENITLLVNGAKVAHVSPHTTFEASLKTEIEENGIFKPTTRKTVVKLYDRGQAWLYEMGLPICEIDCAYSIDVQQKVPLSTDRDSVSPAFLKQLYAEVLNHTYNDIQAEDSAQVWIRTAFSSDRISREAVADNIAKRFGDKAAIDNPFDRYSKDKAISQNFTLIKGGDMSREEWEKVKGYNVVPTTTALFGVTVKSGVNVEPTDNQRRVGEFARKIALEIMGFKMDVCFLESCGNAYAHYNDADHMLTFGIREIPASYWQISAEGHVNESMLDLIIHEIGHEYGWHYEASYHKAITHMGAALALKALSNPGWFKI